MRKRDRLISIREAGKKTLRDAERLLWAARELYADRSTATVRAFARDRSGHRIPLGHVNDPRAVRWGPTGSLLRSAHAGWGVETVVVIVPPGSQLDLTGPRFVLVAIDCLAEALTAVFRHTHASRPASPSLPVDDNPFLTLLERTTPAARSFWVATFIAELPEIRRAELLTAFSTAALIVEVERDRRNARQS